VDGWQTDGRMYVRMELYINLHWYEITHTYIYVCVYARVFVRMHVSHYNCISHSSPAAPVTTVTPCSRVLSQKLICPKQVKKFHAFYAT
jgi:hypothetical protein